MNNQTTNQDQIAQTPINQSPIVPEPVSQEPIIPPQAPLIPEPAIPESTEVVKVPPRPEIEITPEPEFPPQPQPEITPTDPINPEPIEGVKPTPSNQYEQVLNQYATKTPTINPEPVKVPPRSSDQQLQDLGISPPPKTGGGFLKVLFIIALIIFILVFAVLGFAYYKSQKTEDTSDSSSFDTVKISPTPASGSCFLNDKTYQVGESFAAADGCNTCSCESQDVITCTEKACVTPTKSATTSAIPKISPEKVVLNFFQGYIKTSPFSYKDSPYLTSSLIKSLDEIKIKTPNMDPVLHSQLIPDCGVTTGEPTIENNSATVTVFLCHKSDGKQYLDISLILENGQWKINKIATP